ncbi:MAG TPA: DUF389 domain-containing protein [Polyangiaceae bacterium]
MARSVPRPIVRVQDRLALIAGFDPKSRAGVTEGMIRRDLTEVTSYWLQLVVSVGIATLGLVLGSTAVIIGAMLIAPLMTPIINLGMGLACGSPFLVLRASSRVALSVITAIGSAAGITLLLPFHEFNAEIAARTSPTVLDLLVASFCAFAAVYAALRAGSDTTSTAAGTAIGISLVPPLCASGYGIGAGSWAVAGGAAMLFLTNLVAIIVVATLCFLLVGFNQVEVAGLERDELSHGGNAPIARSLARRLARAFESPGGAWLRMLMPLVLLGVVYVPLRRALDEVAWEFRVRGKVRQEIAKLGGKIVQSRVRVERHQVELGVVLVGTTNQASEFRRKLDADVREVSGVTPKIEVLAVPDAKAFAGLESDLQRAEGPLVVAAPSASENLDGARALVSSAIERRWPARSAGAVLQVSVEVTGQPVPVRIAHLGSAVDETARETLELSLESELGQPVRVSTRAIPSGEILRDGNDAQFLARLAELSGASRDLSGLRLCLQAAAAAPLREKQASSEEQFTDALGEILAEHPRLTRLDGEDWRAWVTRASCGPSAEVPSPKLAPD